MSAEALAYLRSRHDQAQAAQPGSELVRVIGQLIADLEAEQPSKPKKGKAAATDADADE